VIGIGLGFGTSVVFVNSMDDIIYANFRKNVILPFQLVSLSSNATARNIAVTTISGTGRFINEITPHSPMTSSAKELMLKDTDYSTPSDHYFAHLQRLKSEDVPEYVRE